MKRHTTNVKCVQLKEHIQAQQMKEYAHMTDEQRQCTIEQKLANGSSPIAGLWRKLTQRQYSSSARHDPERIVAEGQATYNGRLKHKTRVSRVVR